MEQRPGSKKAPPAGPGVRGRLLRVAVVALAPLLLLELALRLAGPHIAPIEPLLYHSKIAHRYDEAHTLEALLQLTVLGFQPRTRSRDFILNSRSQRAYEYSNKKPPDTLRLLAFGDSFTFAMGVPFEAGWTVRLESLLEERLEHEVEVLNLGAPAVGTEFQLRLWQLEGKKLGADLAIVGFTVGSNFAVSTRARRELTLSESIAVWSYAYRLARNVVRLNAFRARRPPSQKAPERLPIPAGASGVLVADVVPHFKAPYDPEWVHMSDTAFANLQEQYLGVCAGRHMEARFEFIAQVLARFRDEVVATGTDFLVVIFPAELQVNSQLLREVIARTNLKRPPTEDEVFAPQEFLRAFFEREGIRYLDLLPAFRAAAAEGPLYGVQDSHWNVPGNLLAAEVLAEHLSSPARDGKPWPWQDLISKHAR